MLPSQLTSTVPVKTGRVASVALCFPSLAICCFQEDLSPFAFWSLLPHPWCPSCSLPGSCVPRLWLGCGCLGPATERGIRRAAVLCASGGAVCAPARGPCPRLSACLQACTRLVCSSSPQDLLLKFRGETNSPLEARELRLHPLIVTPGNHLRHSRLQAPGNPQPPPGMARASSDLEAGAA